MKLLGNRKPSRELDSGDVDLLLYLFVLLRDGLPAYRALSARRTRDEGIDEAAPEALAWARGLAYAYTAARTLMEHPDEPLEERVPPELYPVQPLAALAELAYGFSGLSEQRVVEAAVLSPEGLAALIGRYAADSWVEAMRQMVDRVAGDTDRRADDLPGVDVDVIPAPVPEGGMTPLRTFLLAEELPSGRDLPPLPEGPHEVTFPLFMRLIAMIFLLAHHGDLYIELQQRWENEPSPDLEATAIEAANDIALVLLWIWRRFELLAALRGTQVDPAVACETLAELYSGFLLATSPHQAHRDMLLDPEYLASRLRNPGLTRLVAGLGFEATFITDVRAELLELRKRGASQPELLVHALERVGRETDGLEPEDV